MESRIKGIIPAGHVEVICFQYRPITLGCAEGNDATIREVLLHLESTVIFPVFVPTKLFNS